MDIKRGREKTVASPDGEARKKKGSLFRRASLSRKKNKEEAKMRSKSKDRYAEHSQSTNTLSMPRNKVKHVSKIYKNRFGTHTIAATSGKLVGESHGPSLER